MGFVEPFFVIPYNHGMSEKGDTWLWNHSLLYHKWYVFRERYHMVAEAFFVIPCMICLQRKLPYGCGTFLCYNIDDMSSDKGYIRLWNLSLLYHTWYMSEIGSHVRGTFLCYSIHGMWEKGFIWLRNLSLLGLYHASNVVSGERFHILMSTLYTVHGIP